MTSLRDGLRMMRALRDDLADGRKVLEPYTEAVAEEALYAMALAVISVSVDGWDWADVSGIALDETTDTPLLVATIRLTYNA